MYGYINIFYQKMRLNFLIGAQQKHVENEIHSCRKILVQIE